MFFCICFAFCGNFEICIRRQLTAVISNLLLLILIFKFCAINILESLRCECAKYYLTFKLFIYLFISSRIDDKSTQSDPSVCSNEQYSVRVGNTHMSVCISTNSSSMLWLLPAPCSSSRSSISMYSLSHFQFRRFALAVQVADMRVA